MIKLFSVIGLFVIGGVASIYSFSVGAVDNGLINFNNYRGKKILLVNTATQSPQAGQMALLQQLYQLHQDSLVVIAFPSNSFGNEPGSNASIKHAMLDSAGISFPVAAKSSVTGTDVNAVYRWLRNKNQNEMVNDTIGSDFNKILIDEKGKVIGLFDSSTSPLSAVLQNALRLHN